MEPIILLTLFIVPAFYKLLARRSGSPERTAKVLDELAGEHHSAVFSPKNR